MAEEGKSKLYLLKPLIEKWPAVSKPEGHVAFKTKIFWTVFCLLLYFMLTKVSLYGVKTAQLDVFANFRAILAGQSGSVMHLGIGPIVTGSIIMQLFTGAKIIKLDLTKKEDKAIYQGTQKIVVMAMILVEAIPQVYGFLSPDDTLIQRLNGVSWLGANHGRGWAETIIVAQLAFGAIVVFFMDELISKWGIGSGISLFIAAGVSEQIVTGTFNWQRVDPNTPYNPAFNPPSGALPKFIYVFTQRPIGSLVYEGGFEDVFLGNQQFPNSIMSLVGTIVIFFFVVYAESARIELPLAHGKVRGARGRYPIRLIYASNIPVILISALLANVNLFALLFTTHPTFSRTPLIGGKWWIGMYPPASGGGSTSPIGGGAWYLTSFQGFQEWFLPLLDFHRYGSILHGHEIWQLLIRMAIYLTVYIGGSIMFAKFWIETTNMGPHDVAKQIQSSGMQIPGFRRDPRVLQRILERYIPTVTVIGAVVVGGLAAFADMIGTVGSSSGTGVLLTVGIIIRMYEQIAKEQAMEMHPVLRGFFGKEL
jgi:preprotein translocase subunit SecY